MLDELDDKLDKRLVATFLGLLQTIISFRDRVNGLLLSELGGYLLTPRQGLASGAYLWATLASSILTLVFDNVIGNTLAENLNKEFGVA